VYSRVVLGHPYDLFEIPPVAQTACMIQEISHGDDLQIFGEFREVIMDVIVEIYLM